MLSALQGLCGGMGGDEAREQPWQWGAYRLSVASAPPPGPQGLQHRYEAFRENDGEQGEEDV